MKQELVLSLATVVTLAAIPGCQTGPTIKESDAPPFAAITIFFES